MRAPAGSTQVAHPGDLTRFTGPPGPPGPTGFTGIDDIQLVWWPEQAELRTAEPTTTARLLLVAPDAEPPVRLGFLEDWMRLPLDPAEFASRHSELLRRMGEARPLTLDEDGLVRRGRSWVALSPLEVALFRPLLEHRGRVVARSVLLASAREHTTATDPSFLDTYIRRLRDRLGPLGAAIRTVRGVGHMLDVR
jgi:DNA-binding response OmpR family regulator